MSEENLKIGQKKTICVDPCWTLHQWNLFITEQTEKYGPRSILSVVSEEDPCYPPEVDLVLEKRE